MANGIAIIVFAIIITYFIAKICLKVLKAIYDAIPESSISDTDYWNDAGDGSGVNYVQMPDGSVRID